MINNSTMGQFNNSGVNDNMQSMNNINYGVQDVNMQSNINQSVNVMSNNCPNCGTKIVNDSTFCTNCGYNLK